MQIISKSICVCTCILQFFIVFPVRIKYRPIVDTELFNIIFITPKPLTCFSSESFHILHFHSSLALLYAIIHYLQSELSERSKVPVKITAFFDGLIPVVLISRKSQCSVSFLTKSLAPYLCIWLCNDGYL